MKPFDQVRIFDQNKPQWTGYYYWDTPDGQDCHKKMWFAAKIGTATGLVMSLYDISLLSHPKGYFQGVSRVAYFTVPAVSVGIAFSALTCAMTQFRNKDDEWNYVLSGFAAGSIWGAARQNVGTGIRAGSIVAGLALISKIFHGEGWDFFGGKPQMFAHGSYNFYKYDWTFLKDPKDKDKDK